MPYVSINIFLYYIQRVILCLISIIQIMCLIFV
nr:MAG TPA: hypothetical protein [Bacteriophage sp.]